MSAIARRFGQMVRTARTAQHLSQEELGTRVGVAHTQISRVESGTRAPSFQLFTALVAALDLDLGELNARDEQLTEPESAA